jgi:hypothetical protein
LGKVKTCSLPVESKLIESNPRAGYLKGVISRASRSFLANRATPSNFLLTGKTLPARTQYLTGEKQLDVYWQTLCAGQMPEGFSTAKKDFCYKALHTPPDLTPIRSPCSPILSPY